MNPAEPNKPDDSLPNEDIYIDPGLDEPIREPDVDMRIVPAYDPLSVSRSADEIPTNPTVAEPSAGEGANGQHRDFEDLTLAEAMGLFWRKPLSTLRAVVEVAQTPKEGSELYRRQGFNNEFAWALPHAPITNVEPSAQIEAYERSMNRQIEGFQLALRVVAFVLAWWGGLLLASAPSRSEPALNASAPFWLLAFAIWMVSEVVGFATSPSRRIGAQVYSTPAREGMNGLILRLGAVGIGTIFSLFAFQYSAGNRFTLEGVVAWLGSIVFWVWAVAPPDWTPLTPFVGIGRAIIRFRPRWTTAALIAITVIGAAFRLYDLAGTPPEMTSDHVEKVLDAYRVSNGQFDIFFANNHGRDPLQFYLLALLARVGGLEFNFNLLKLLTAIEGIITIPVLYFMGRAVIGKEDRKLGDLVGLLLAALVAVSFWHEMLSRLGLRIVLTSLVTALLLIVLVRALRENRRSDFILVGLVLGFGVYTYQAARMLPVVVILGVGLALVLNMRTWRDRGRMLVNLAVAGLVAFVVFVPLFRYSLEYPEDFWRRTSGRLFGDAISQTTNEEGVLIFRQATLEERLNAFFGNLPALATNYRNALLMYNYKGDIAWINNAPIMPALDTMAGALLIVGCAAWLGRMIGRRDAADFLIPVVVLVMLLPTALAIAYPIENPSFTRSSGTLPAVYFMAAFALALLARSVARVLPRLIGHGVAVVAVVGLLFVSYSANSNTFFNDYRRSYMANSLPYYDAGRLLRSFAENAGGYGNAFIIGYPYWWDHRALGIEGGRVDWPNGIPSLQDAPRFLADAANRAGEYRLDVSRDLLFFYSPDDSETDSWLRAFFPQGVSQNIVPYQPEDDYNVYRVPALGADGFARFIQMSGAN